MQKITDMAAELCDDIENGEYELTWDFDGHYDGFWGESETLVDQDGLGKQVESLIESAMFCVIARHYKQAHYVFNALFSIDIPNDYDTMARGFALGRFEGFNNEPDMETPYNYLFAGRHDKLCDILTAGMTELFSADRIGLPGNNDSGGLSSCYVWNTLGIFPVFASGTFLLGRPFFERAELRLDKGRTLTILAHGLTRQTRYVRCIAFNGEMLRHPWLDGKVLLAGGTLEFWMAKECATLAQI